MTAVSNKDTIYIDADDDITTIIDKVSSAKSKIVAVVLPKRSTTLQSIVNLRLLKRTADSNKKNLVLVTSDHNVLPLAGAVGLHVAKTPLSKPTIPDVPIGQGDGAPDDDSFGDAGIDDQAPIGALAAAASSEEVIELDNDTTTGDNSDSGSKKSKNKSKKDKSAKGANKKLRVPDFNRFRLMFFGAIGLIILLVIIGIYAFSILPRAKVTIKTDSASTSTNVDITAQTGIASADIDSKIVPGYVKTIKKTDTEKV
ncbi:MAG: hypothetical protein ABI354_00880, partial [Candidatus Saccharimonadales bacterium]